MEQNENQSPSTEQSDAEANLDEMLVFAGDYQLTQAREVGQLIPANDEKRMLPEGYKFKTFAFVVSGADPLNKIVAMIMSDEGEIFAATTNLMGAMSSITGDGMCIAKKLIPALNL